MSTKFSLRKFFKCSKSKGVENPEAQSGRHSLFRPATSPIASETMTPEPRQPQSTTTAASVHRKPNRKASSSNISEPQAPSNPSVNTDSQQTPAIPHTGARSPPLSARTVQETSSHVVQAQDLPSVAPSETPARDAASVAPELPQPQNPSVATSDAATNNQVQSKVPSVSLESLSTRDVPPSAAAALTSVSPAISQAPASKQMNFWYQAYIQCYESKETRGLMNDLTSLLLSNENHSSSGKRPVNGDDGDTLDKSEKPKIALQSQFENFNISMESRLRKDIKALEKHKWKISVRKWEVEVKDVVKSFVDIVAGAKDFVGTALSTNPQAALAWSAVCFGLQFIENPIKGQERFIEAFKETSRLIQRYSIVERTYSRTVRHDIGCETFEGSPDLEDAITSLYSAILVYQAHALRYLEHRSARRILNDTFKPDQWINRLQDIKQEEEKCDKLLDTLGRESLQREFNKQSEQVKKVRSGLMNSFQQQLDGIKRVEDKLNDVIDLQMLDRLSPAKHAAFNSDKSRCLPSTRVDIRTKLIDWSKSDDPDTKSIFWISGMAGMGKSTIARTVAEHLVDRGHLVASFFFSRGEADRDNATKLIDTIAFQLADSSTILRSRICGAIRKRLTVVEDNLVDKWEGLIEQPLQGLERLEVEDVSITIQPSTVVLVIDALDECTNKGIIDFFLVLERVRNLKFVRFRVLITSREEIDISNGMGRLEEDINRYILSTISPEIDSDLRDYYENELGRIRKMYLQRREMELKSWKGDLPDPNAWPGLDGWPQEADITQLVKSSGGLFQYATIVCRIIGIEKGTPLDRLQGFLETTLSGRQTLGGLDEIYLKALEHSIPSISDDGDSTSDDEDSFFNRFRQIVGAIVLSFDPLSSWSLTCLLGPKLNHKAVTDTLDRLRSVLDITEGAEPVKVIHTSFRDFLINKKRCTKQEFQINEEEIHERLFRGCMAVMSSEKGLKEDRCNLKAPGARIVERKKNTDGSEVVERSEILKHITPEVQYACRFWVNHLGRTKYNPDLFKLALEFLKVYFLNWLEALSWIRKTSEGLLAICSLELLISDEKSSDLYKFVYDAKRFALYNRLAIEQTPLQLYCSALVFAPERSIVRNQFKKSIPHWVQRKSKVQADWSAALQTLEGHSDSVSSVAFSPDGRQVVSGSADKTVRLWDAAIGAALYTLEGHSGSVSSVAFSPDGKQVVSGSSDGTVRLWDAASGAALQTLYTLKGHSGAVDSVAFSPDGKQVVSGSSFGIRLWDAASGVALYTLEGHSDLVCSVALSADGKRVVSGSSYGTVRLWDAATRAALYTLEGHLNSVYSVAFSPNGKQVVSGSSDGTVRLWDVATRAALYTLYTLEGHSDWVWSSRDGKQVVSGSSDRTVRLWDAAIGAAQTLEGHLGWVKSVAFSADGKRIVSGSSDGTVQLWDAATGAALPALQTLKGPSDSVKFVAFSADGKQVVSRSNNKTVRRWDVASGAALYTPEGHSDWAMFMAFSPNGKQVVSGSDDKTVRLWDAVTGVAQTLKGHSGWVMSVAFSADGKQIVSGSSDKTVRLWNATSGAALQTLKGHLDLVKSVAFSPNSKQVVSGSNDKTVWLWDAASGAALQTFEGHLDSVWFVAFSPDGKQVVSGSSDGTVRLWDAASGAALETLECHSDSVGFVASQYDKEEPDFFIPSDWIVEGDTNILWLPPDYRATCEAVWNKVIVLGHSSGRISILSFDKRSRERLTTSGRILIPSR